VPETREKAVFFGIATLIFLTAATATVIWSQSMADMGTIPLPGGNTMSAMWTPMCGQTWLGAAASFVGMWTVMMVAMMMPSLAPGLWRYRAALEAEGEVSRNGLVALAGAAYLGVWALLGLAIFAAGAALLDVLMRLPALARTLPFAEVAALLLSVAFQLATWKARLLAPCNGKAQGAVVPGRTFSTAWRHGWRFGVNCCFSCAGLTVLVLVTGVMDPGVMAFVTAAISTEKLAAAHLRQEAWIIAARHGQAR
jgi:predicted metal-binding membrane protein